MDLQEARRMGTDLMAAHGLTGWLLDFDDAKVRAGLCRFDRRTISLSRPLTLLYGPSQVRETLLHEIAHALVGPAHGHGPAWREVARRIGSTAERCVAPEAPRAPAPWLGTCPQGHTVTRHRQPSRPASCTRCSPAFDVTVLFSWRFHGREVPMSAGYQAAMRQLLGRPATAGAATALAGPAPVGPTHGRTDAHEPTLWGPDDDAWASATRDDEPAALAALGALPVGTAVTLQVRGRYAGLDGVIERRARTRYHVRTRAGLLTVPFPGVVPVRD